jgi:NADH dehydrogenase
MAFRTTGPYPGAANLLAEDKRVILITGGTGFVGRHVVARLVEAGEAVRVLARSRPGLAGAEIAQGDVTDPAVVAAAARGCDAVIHLVGIIRERGDATFQSVHVEGTRAVLRACQEAGVPRLLHMSALGSRPHARSRYHQTKWEAEELVRASGLAATIFRPSVIVGPVGGFLPEVRGLLHRGPVIPIIGSGKSLLQPVWIEDVVSCFVAALARPATVGHAYEIAGPETFTFEQIVALVAEAEGVRKRRLHLPVAMVRPAVWMMSRLVRGFPLTSEQLTMLLEDNVCDTSAMREDLGVEPDSIRGHLRE